MNERRRDEAVAAAMAELDVAIHGVDDSVLVPPRVLRTGKGTPYTVFGRTNGAGMPGWTAIFSPRPR